MRLSKIEQFKDLIGKDIYCTPTGNAARRGSVPFEIMKLISVGRKYLKLETKFGIKELRAEDGASRESVNSGYGGNSGYMFFDSEDGFLNYEDHCKLASEVSKIAYWFRWQDLSEEDLAKVYEVIKKH